MARGRSPDRDRAFELWKQSGGEMKLKDIASEVGVSDTLVRKWKNQDQWEQKVTILNSNGNVTNGNGNVTNQKVTPNIVTFPGQCEATSHKTGERCRQKARPGESFCHVHLDGWPGQCESKSRQTGERCKRKAEPGKRVCKHHGGKSTGPPPGSKNALKTGEHEAIWFDTLEEDECVLLFEIDTDPIKQADETIMLLTIRERRMLKRIQDLKNGLTEKQRRVLQERRTIKEAVTVHDEKTGQTKVITVPRDELVVAEVEETEYRAIDDIIRLEEALTRVQDKKVKAIKTKFDLMGEDERRLRIEKMKQEIEIARERLQLEKAKVMGPPDETEDDGFIDALSDKAGEAWNDYSEEAEE